MKLQYTRSGMNKFSLVLLITIGFMLGGINKSSAATSPAAQALPYSQNFGALAAGSSVYPAGWQGWAVGTSSGSTFKTVAPTLDATLTAPSGASITSGGVHNYSGKIGLLSSGSVDAAICLAITTTGISNVLISFDAMTIRNPYDGSGNTRINGFDLQYIVGPITGTWASVSGLGNGVYQNNTTLQVGSGVTTPQNVLGVSLTLPAACNNQSVVYLRWVQRDISGGGSRASFAVDNISVCSPPVIGACPSNITQCTPVATFSTPTSTGTPAASVSCSPASGSTFSLGTTTVTCTATSTCGSPSACSFTVTINSAPVIGSCPGNITQCNNHVATWTDPTATGTPTPTVACSPASGSTFATGTTTVTCTATNSCGSNSCSFSVTINETPVIGSCPGNITQCDNHVATWANPTATGTPTPTVSCTPASGSTFATGTTSVTCTATNSCGSNSCSFNVTINETPVIGSCPGNITQCDNHVATWTNPTATGTPAPTVSCSPASGSTFATGTTSVTCTATNSCGSNSCSFNVTINETPVIGSCPADIDLCNSNVATWTDPTATGTPAPTVTCVPASGSTFPSGTTSVTCTATNSCGSSSCSFNVNVSSIVCQNGGTVTQFCTCNCPTGYVGQFCQTQVCTPPVIGACPSNITQCDNHVATWTDPTASGTTPTVTCTPASGSTFSTGTTQVTCLASNGCGSDQCSFNVTINESPVIGSCPADITQCDNHVATFSTPTSTGTPGASVACSPVSGSFFATGTTSVTCTATNSCGTSSCSFNVTINESPVIGSCPSDITQCDNHVATFSTPTTTGTPAASVACSPVSGSFFVTGTTSVTCTATNSCGTSSCSFNVTINESPVIGSCPSDITQCDNHVATFSTPTATGTPAASVACTPVSGSFFATGTTSVTCTATNSCGTSSCSFNVTINESPVIGSCPADITTCNPVVTFSTPTATGTPAPTVTCTPASGSTFASGTTSVTCTATNSCGSSSCSFNVNVQTPSTAATSATSNALYGQVCSPGTVTLTANGGSLGTGANWVWYDGACGGVSVGSGATLTLTPGVGSHNYFVRAEGACGNTACQSVAVNVITAPPSATIHYTASIADGCVGAPASVFSVNAVANCTFYNWTSNTAGVRFNGNPSPFQTTVPTVNVTFVSLPTPGTSGWSICVFGGNACGNTNTICTWVRATLSAPTGITGSVIGCPSSIANLYSSTAVAGAATYQWSSTNGIVINGNGSQSITVDFPAGFVSGTLTVHGQSSCGYDGPNKSITITRAPATPGVISGTSYPCPNASTPYSVVAVPGAANYTWTTSVPGAVVTGTSNTCSILFPATIPNGSSVSVIANSSCPFSSAVRSKGIASGMPGVPASISGPASGQCGQTGVSYSISPMPLATGYNWSTTCGTIVGPTNLSGVTVDWPASFNTCTLSVSATNGCGTGTARILAVTGAPAIPGAIAGNAAPCANTFEFYSTAGSAGATSYTWAVPAGSVILGPANGASILVQWGSTSGNITVRGSNACGNSAVRSLPCVISCRLSQVNTSSGSFNAEVYPNPASDKATVKFTAATAAQYHLNMTDVLGQNVLSLDGAATEGINMIELNLGSVAKGVYQLSIMSNGNTEQIKVVIQ